MVAAYQGGMSAKEMSRVYGWARSTITGVLNRHGVVRRSRHEALALSDKWKERLERWEIQRRVNKPLKGGRLKTSDLPLFNAPHITDPKRESKREAARVDFKERYQSDPEFRLKTQYRSRLNKIIFGGRERSRFATVVGCQPRELVGWIESQFVEGMTWETHGAIDVAGSWQVDHVVPVVNGIVSADSDVVWNWRNMRPMWAKENYRKGTRMTADDLRFIESTPDGHPKGDLVEIAKCLIFS
jgi:hypothetical protein